MKGEKAVSLLSVLYQLKSLTNSVKIKVLIIFLAIALSACGQLNNAKNSGNRSNKLVEDAELKKINTTFFEKLKSNGEENALTYLFAKNPSLDAIPLRSKLDTVSAVFGKYMGVEKITEKGIANGLILTSFLVKYERQPVRFTITYYKPKAEWLLYKFQIDENALNELEDSAKLFMLSGSEQ